MACVDKARNEMKRKNEEQEPNHFPCVLPRRRAKNPWPTPLREIFTESQFLDPCPIPTTDYYYVPVYVLVTRYDGEVTRIFRHILSFSKVRISLL